MATLTCDLTGFEGVEVEIPDEWLIRHQRDFQRGIDNAPDGADFGTKVFYGCLELCAVKGLDNGLLDDPESAPLWYAPLFNWLANAVFERFDEAMQPPKN